MHYLLASSFDCTIHFSYCSDLHLNMRADKSMTSMFEVQKQLNITYLQFYSYQTCLCCPRFKAKDIDIKRMSLNFSLCVHLACRDLHSDLPSGTSWCSRPQAAGHDRHSCWCRPLAEPVLCGPPQKGVRFAIPSNGLDGCQIRKGARSSQYLDIHFFNFQQICLSSQQAEQDKSGSLSVS